ncbi:hypothetical protein ACP70R_032468 [Stipagrostis hirtigluma subsp. patula]
MSSSAPAPAGKVVCVTGALGYIASWIVKLLLARGYTVRATVRDTGHSQRRRPSSSMSPFLLGFLPACHRRNVMFTDPKKTNHLRALDGAKDRLHLFKANLLEEGSFDAAIEGCECVFHTASPFYLDVKDPKAELLDPAVKGTLNVLGSCKKASVKRVVVTSSMAAVTFNGKPTTPDVIVDETWFSVPEICEKNQLWYVLSKTLAEEAAWKFSRENGLEIVTINPAMVIGPLLQPTLNTSAEAILKLINGTPQGLVCQGLKIDCPQPHHREWETQIFDWKLEAAAGSSTYPNFSYGWVNVKDVALAHVLAYEHPSANGRYGMVERVAHFSELVNMIRKMYPTIPLPDKCADDKPFVPVYQVSKEKIRSLGIELIPLETSIKETIKSLEEKGFVTFDCSSL